MISGCFRLSVRVIAVSPLPQGCPLIIFSAGVQFSFKLWYPMEASVFLLGPGIESWTLVLLDGRCAAAPRPRRGPTPVPSLWRSSAPALLLFVLGAFALRPGTHLRAWCFGPALPHLTPRCCLPSFPGASPACSRGPTAHCWPAVPQFVCSDPRSECLAAQLPVCGTRAGAPFGPLSSVT